VSGRGAPRVGTYNCGESAGVDMVRATVPLSLTDHAPTDESATIAPSGFFAPDGPCQSGRGRWYRGFPREPHQLASRDHSGGPWRLSTAAPISRGCAARIHQPDVGVFHSGSEDVRSPLSPERHREPSGDQRGVFAALSCDLANRPYRRH